MSTARTVRIAAAADQDGFHALNRRRLAAGTLKILRAKVRPG
jgi:hypothetical protein